MPMLDYSEYDPTKNLRGSAKCEEPGKCELRITFANYKEGKKGPYYLVGFEVLAHVNPKAVGQEYNQFFQMSGTGSKGTLQLAKAAGVVTDEDIQESTLNGKGGIVFDLADGVNAVVYGDIKKSKYNDADSFKIWDFYGPSEPEAKGFPKSDAPGADVKDSDVSGVPVDDGDDDEDDDIPF